MIDLPEGIYLVEGTLDALQWFVPLRNPRFIHLLPHLSPYCLSPADADLLVTPPLEDTDLIAPLAMPTPSRLPAGLRLFQLASEPDGTTPPTAKRALQARLGGLARHLDLKPLVEELTRRPDVAKRLQALSPELQQEVLRLKVYPSRFFSALEEAERGELTPTTSLGLCARLLNSLLEPTAYAVWQSLARDQRYLLFQHTPPLFLDYLTRREPPYGVCPALGYYLYPFLRQRPLEDSLLLFVRWVRFSRGLQRYVRQGRERYLFRPSEEAIHLWQELRIG